MERIAVAAEVGPPPLALLGRRAALQFLEGNLALHHPPPRLARSGHGPGRIEPRVVLRRAPGIVPGVVAGADGAGGQVVIRKAIGLGLQDHIHGILEKNRRVALREPGGERPPLRIKALVAQVEGLVVPAGAHDGLRIDQRPLVEPHKAGRLRRAVPLARGELAVDHRRLDARDGHRRIVGNLLPARAENAKLIQGVLALHVVVADVAAEHEPQVLGLHVDGAKQSLPVLGDLAAAVTPEFQLPPPAEFQVVPLVPLPIAGEAPIANELPLLVPDADAGVH